MGSIVWTIAQNRGQLISIQSNAIENIEHLIRVANTYMTLTKEALAIRNGQM